MGLNLGELTAFINVDDKEFDGGLDQAESKFEGFGDRLQIAGAAIGVAAAGVLSASFVEAMNVDAANDRLAAQLGSTPAEAERLGRIAGELYAGAWGDSMGQVNEALRQVMLNIRDMSAASDQVLHDTTAGVIDLATAFDQDLGAVTRAVGKLMITGLARDATEAMDLLTRSFQGGTDQAGDLLDTVSEYSTKFRDLGLSGHRALGILQQGLQGGARDADIVADALKEFSIRAIDGSELTASGFAMIGLSASDMAAQIGAGGSSAATALDTVLDRLRAIADPVARDAAAVALFGTQAEDLGDAPFSLDPSAAVDALGAVSGATAEMGTTLADNASTQLEAFKRQVQSALVEKVAAALPILEAVMGFLGEHQEIIGPVVIALTALATIIGIVTAVQWAWNIAMAASPVGLIIMGVMLLVGAIIWLATQTTFFQDIWTAAWGWIKDAASAVWDWFQEVWPTILETLTLPLRLFIAYQTWVWGMVRGGAGSAVDWVQERWNALVGFVTGLPPRVGRAAAGMWDSISDNFRATLNRMIGWWNGLSWRLAVPDNMLTRAIGLAGAGFTLGTPDLPMLAEGGHILRGGLAMVGERGREVVHLPRGATVEPLNTAAGRQEVFVRLLLLGDGILRGLREEIQVQGGDVQAVLGG